MASNAYGGDWLNVDDSYLPTNQLLLLRSMLGRKLINIQRSIRGTPDTERISHQDFFRKGRGPIIFELEGLSPIYFNDQKYDRHEISIDVDSKPPTVDFEKVGMAHHYTLYDREYVDDRLHLLIGQHILAIRILIRKPDLLRDKAQALQDGIEITFDKDTIIVSYYLNKVQSRLIQILYPEEIAWQAVEYTVDVAKGKTPCQYRFNRWKWRALDRLGRWLGFE